MFNREFRVKKGSGAFLVKGIFSLIMFLLSLCCSLFPKLRYIESSYTIYIVIIGLLGCAYFSFMFMMTVISGIKPSDALVLTENGIYDFITYPGKGLFIDWENISAVKIIGSEKSPILGIDLFDTEIFIGTLKKSIGEEIRTNIEAGLPAIVIKESEVASKLSHILPAFNDFINATRPIPTADKLAGVNSFTSTDNFSISSDITDEIQLINKVESYTEDDKNEDDFLILPTKTAPTLPDADEIKTIKTAKKDMDEIFVLPPERKIDSGNVNSNKSSKKSNPSVKHDFNSQDDDDDPIPMFSEFVMENKPVSNTNIKKSTAVHTEDVVTTKPENSVKNEKAKSPEQKIKTLDELLSSFSVPIIENTDNSSESK